jgi:hypothetical protein
VRTGRSSCSADTTSNRCATWPFSTRDRRIGCSFCEPASTKTAHLVKDGSEAGHVLDRAWDNESLRAEATGRKGVI